MPTSNFVETPSLRIHYLKEGEASAGRDPVIMLHGFPQTSHMWRHQIPVVAADHVVYAPDTRGYGKTDKPRMRLTRDILARDVIEFMDALGIERAQLVAHDWGGLIAFKASVDYPDRFSKLALFDTLTSVWITWGIHGYWFKCEPQAEQFFEKHHKSFIRSMFGGEERDYEGPPYSPWAPVPGSAGHDAHADYDPTKYWTKQDVDHYDQAFSDPGSWFHCIEYYRHCLPFHIEHEDPSSPNGLRFEFLSSPKVAEMWNHPGLLFSHPDYEKYMTFAPEDRHKTYPGPTLYVFSPFLMPQAFENGPPPDDYVMSGNPYAESFPRHFPDLRTRGLETGHFIPEEDPEGVNRILTDFIAGRI